MIANEILCKKIRLYTLNPRNSNACKGEKSTTNMGRM